MAMHGQIWYNSKVDVLIMQPFNHSNTVEKYLQQANLQEDRRAEEVGNCARLEAMP